jgi:hypothetical protein
MGTLVCKSNFGQNDLLISTVAETALYSAMTHEIHSVSNLIRDIPRSKSSSKMKPPGLKNNMTVSSSGAGSRVFARRKL